jgi:hypothetical protein
MARSVADDFRQRTVERVLALSIDERIALALSLGDDDRRLFMRFTGTGAADATRHLRAARTRGRQPSVANRITSP